MNARLPVRRTRERVYLDLDAVSKQIGVNVINLLLDLYADFIEYLIYVRALYVYNTL